MKRSDFLKTLSILPMGIISGGFATGFNETPKWKPWDVDMRKHFAKLFVSENEYINGTPVYYSDLPATVVNYTKKHNGVEIRSIGDTLTLNPAMVFDIEQIPLATKTHRGFHGCKSMFSKQDIFDSIRKRIEIHNNTIHNKCGEFADVIVVHDIYMAPKHTDGLIWPLVRYGIVKL